MLKYLVNQKPIFSIIIPALNEAKYLPACLKSLQKQDFPQKKYEIIVIDNGSTDKTSKIAKQFRAKLVLEPKKSIIKARLAGYKKALGKYLINLDADCQVPSHWLNQINTVFDKHPKIIAVAGATYSKGQDFYSRYLLKAAPIIYHISTKIWKNPLAFWTVNLAVKAKSLKNIYQSFPPDFPNSAEVLGVVCSLKKQGKIYFDKNLLIQESDRRYQNRTLSFMIKDFLGGILNFYLYKLCRKTISAWKDFR